MKFWKKRPLIALALILLIALSLLSLTLSAVAQDAGSNSGVSGLQGPEFTVGFFLAASLGNNPAAATSGQAVFNGAPFTLSGYVLTKYSGSLHVWLSQYSQVVNELGFKPGDVVEVFCAESQIQDLNVGDYVEILGFTARGYLVRTDHTVLPAPFSY